MGDTKRRGRGWGRTLLGVGAAFSVISNGSHTWLYPRPDGVDVPAWRALVRLNPDYTPAPWAMAVSALWPFLVWLVIEAMARVQWPSGFWSYAARIGGLLPVGSVAAVVSYTHMSSLLAYHGASRLEATIGPVAIDGAMLMGTAILLLTADRSEAKDSRPLAVRVAEARASAMAVRDAARGREPRQELPVPAAGEVQSEVPVQPVPEVPVVVPPEVEGEVPTPPVSEVPEEVPARPRVKFRPRRTGSSGQKKPAGSVGTSARRPAAETRSLAANIEQEHPGISRKDLAAQLGISTRQLANVYPAPNRTPVNGSVPELEGA